jgi:hypothetical protein
MDTIGDTGNKKSEASGNEGLQLFCGIPFTSRRRAGSASALHNLLSPGLERMLCGSPLVGESRHPQVRFGGSTGTMTGPSCKRSTIV